MISRRKIRIGDLLVEKGVITADQLVQVLMEQRQSGRKLGRILVDRDYIGEDALARFLSEQLNIPFVDLDKEAPLPEIVRLIPELHARRFRAIAIRQEAKGLLVGMPDPANIFSTDELSRLLRVPVLPAIVKEKQLLETFDRVYRKTEQISGLAEQLNDSLSSEQLDGAELGEDQAVTDAPVVKLLRSIFEDAVQTRSSDVHIEPDADLLRIRQRIDGVLYEQILDEKRIIDAMVVRLKLMAGLDISERRLPQDGRFSLQIKDRSIDIRLSTMPVQHGESIVMRLLDKSAGLLDLNALGMPDALRDRFTGVVRRPHGMVLVTGPTGSGKTTTLYSALNLLNTADVKIITAENPVEYQLPRINQVNINSEIGLTFAQVLRAALRQDPDVILVGEMRDQETVEIGLRAAMTGHLVLSSLHTNDATSAVTRLVDMGAPGYLLATSLNAILAQRLVRRVCEFCRQPSQPSSQIRGWLEANGHHEALYREFFLGSGCPRCNDTGYSGRVGVYELLEMNPAMIQALSSNDSAEFIRQAKAATKRDNLSQAAIHYAIDGVTSIEEALRISDHGASKAIIPREDKSAASVAA